MNYLIKEKNGCPKFRFSSTLNSILTVLDCTTVLCKVSFNVCCTQTALESDEGWWRGGGRRRRDEGGCQLRVLKKQLQVFTFITVCLQITDLCHVPLDRDLFPVF